MQQAVLVIGLSGLAHHRAIGVMRENYIFVAI